MMMTMGLGARWLVVLLLAVVVVVVAAAALVVVAVVLESACTMICKVKQMTGRFGHFGLVQSDHNDRSFCTPSKRRKEQNNQKNRSFCPCRTTKTTVVLPPTETTQTTNIKNGSVLPVVVVVLAATGVGVGVVVVVVVVVAAVVVVVAVAVAGALPTNYTCT